jgi:hypothetical protein
MIMDMMSFDTVSGLICKRWNNLQRDKLPLNIDDSLSMQENPSCQVVMGVSTRETMAELLGMGVSTPPPTGS